MAEIPVVSIVGLSESGKTTLMDNLIRELVRRGIRVATIKHNPHGHEPDREGKDTWRHRQAGAVCAVLSSPRSLALFRTVEREADLDEIRGMVGDVDIILTEGYKRQSFPKIVVCRKEAGSPPLFTESDTLLAMVTDAVLDTDVPCFTFGEVGKLADLIKEYIHGRAFRMGGKGYDRMQ